MPDVRGIISTSYSGVDVVFEWKIENFFNLPERDDEWYKSPYFSFGGESWYLAIYPNGSSGSNSSGHVDLWLVKCYSDHSIKQSFSLSLKTAKGEKYNEQNFTTLFGRMYPENYHKLLRFTSRSELTMRRSELLPEAVLTVVCTMKNSTSAGNTIFFPSTISLSEQLPQVRVPTGNTASASAECRHCKGTFNADSLSSHRKKCSHRPTKCPDCFEVVVLEKWLNEHECQQERPEARKEHKENSEKTGLNASTQTEERDTGKKHKENSENTGVNASTQTEEKDRTQWTLLTSGNSHASADDGSLSQYFKKVLLEGMNHDLILKVGDKELRAHRDVLRARSQVFKSMLDHDMKEKNSGIIDIPDCDPLAMEQFLFYIYSGNIETLDQSNMLNLYYIADKYEMKELKKECSDFIRESLSQANICDVIQLALNHSDSSLLERTTVYFRNNMLGILHTVEWQVFMKENATVANELLIKSVENLSNVKS